VNEREERRTVSTRQWIASKFFRAERRDAAVANFATLAGAAERTSRWVKSEFKFKLKALKPLAQL